VEGPPPTDGITEAEYDAMKAVLISSFWPDYINHFSTVCTENGLELVAYAD
jgi:hypothetical protein